MPKKKLPGSPTTPATQVFGELNVKSAPGAGFGAGVWAVVGLTADVSRITSAGLPETAAVVAQSTSDPALYASSEQSTGIFGETNDAKGRGIMGQALLGGDAAFGAAMSGGRGVVGTSDTHTGVEGNSDSGAGVWGSSKTGEAGHFEGDVTVTGDLSLTGADFTEQFDLSAASESEPGTVMIIDDNGTLSPCNQPYDRRAVGVVSGAGEYKAAIVLDKRTSDRRVAIALLGKTLCKVNADLGAIEIGDLITTSPMPGHAMKASDTWRAFGCVIGKALRPLARGMGMIPILVVMQ